MAIVLKDLGLTYFSIPKVANTSLKQYLYHAETGRPWAEAPEAHNNVHYYWRNLRGFPTVPPRNIDAFLRKNGAKDSWSFALVRDPIKRLLSAFSNRVEHHKDIKKNNLPLTLVHRLLNVPQDPSLEQFFNRFDSYRTLHGIIKTHTDPQSVFLGGRLDHLDAIFRIEDIGALHKELVKRTGLEIALPHSETGGKKYTIDDLDDQTWDKLVKITAPEYEFLEGLYDLPKRKKTSFKKIPLTATSDQ